MSGGIATSSMQQFLLLLLLLLLGIFLQSIPGLSDDPTNPRDGANSESNAPNLNNNKRELFLICLGIVGVVLLSVFLFKLWQKKKREEQHARLLRLFEEDDELELELGLHD